MIPLWEPLTPNSCLTSIPNPHPPIIPPWELLIPKACLTFIPSPLPLWFHYGNHSPRIPTLLFPGGSPWYRFPYNPHPYPFLQVLFGSNESQFFLHITGNIFFPFPPADLNLRPPALKYVSLTTTPHHTLLKTLDSFHGIMINRFQAPLGQISNCPLHMKIIHKQGS